jgi:hypothetical protein
MEFEKRLVLLHGHQEINVLTPTKLNQDVTVTTDGYGNYFIQSNGTGYAYLSELFAHGISLQKNEILYLPLAFSHTSAYADNFPGLKENHYSGLVLFNYCTAQFSAKEILTSIKTKIYHQEVVSRTCEFSHEYVNRWKTRHRTTVKESGAFVIISTNSDGFTSFAQSCGILAEYGDDTQYNKYPPHSHHDWDENTSKSLGIILYYWQAPENDIIKNIEP